MLTPVPRDLPSGTVTFLFTDIQGSTSLLHELGAKAYSAALAEHRQVLREAFTAHGGFEVDTQGDAFFVAFPTAAGALGAAREALEGLAQGRIRVRMGIHTGTPHLDEEGYVGVDVHRAARIAAVGHGDQVLISASTVALLGTDGLRDLGDHRLKDLSAPERIHQLGDRDFPPLKSLHHTNLPIAPTPFVGRARELGEVLAQLSQEHVRLLTLTGPGGTGKTRLALQAAAAASDGFPDGVFWVPLAPLRGRELVLETVGQTLGATTALKDHIMDKSMLLVLDNFEHLVDAAADLPELLATCPRLHMLVTSRELLGVAGEHVYLVPPLQAQDGQELFVARARAARATFQPSSEVAALCARLENLPLALELAASRLRIMSPEQLIGRLSSRLDLLKGGRGVDPRQQTLRATIEWSHELLDKDEQRLFARLAVFRGGCTLEAAEEVCDVDLDTLQSLTDKSLLRLHDGERFWMLETIREFSAERLEESGEAQALRGRHAEHFLVLAEEAEPHVRRSSGEWLGRVEAEHDNLRAALDWLESSGQIERALRIAGAVSDFWASRGHFVEGRRRLEALLRADASPTAARAKALNAASDMALAAGDLPMGKVRAEEALEIHRRLGNEWGAAHSWLMLGDASADEGDWRSGRQRYQESAGIFRQLGDEHFAILASRLLAWMYSELGDSERARELNEDNLRLARETGNGQLQVHALEALAFGAMGAGRFLDAVPMLEEAYGLNRDVDDPFRMAVSVCRFASVLASTGAELPAAQLLACSDALLNEAGAKPRWVERINEQTLAMVVARLDTTAFAEAWEFGQGLTADEAVALALSSLD
jgi:predicted ATPase/class 3 adenylate cyclase